MEGSLWNPLALGDARLSGHFQTSGRLADQKSHLLQTGVKAVAGSGEALAILDARSFRVMATDWLEGQTGDKGNPAKSAHSEE